MSLLYFASLLVFIATCSPVSYLHSEDKILTADEIIRQLQGSRKRSAGDAGTDLNNAGAISSDSRFGGTVERLHKAHAAPQPDQAASQSLEEQLKGLEAKYCVSLKRDPTRCGMECLRYNFTSTNKSVIVKEDFTSFIDISKDSQTPEADLANRLDFAADKIMVAPEAEPILARLNLRIIHAPLALYSSLENRIYLHMNSDCQTESVTLNAGEGNHVVIAVTNLDGTQQTATIPASSQKKGKR